MSRLKFTKEVVIEAGYELMKKEGFQNVSVRKIANYLKCSTAPIYFNFSTVDELKEEIINMCKEKLKKYLFGNYSERKILSVAIGFVIFAREEKELFRTIFLDTTERFEKIYEETLRELLTKENLLESFPALEEDEAKNAVTKIWYFLFGYATILCTRLDDNYRKNETNEIIENKIAEIVNHFKMQI
ncbi:TetR/AcrR family transcriptional regulator [Leptotrichia trevisanii]|uniref:TetR/AcrR family transcriptional regulator n=1 Tax=Leptotrichia trevisanii TaxID=109328 RepID=UPI0026F2B386|nr:TetR family transcriptional regulator [Leptotrichia trevisanii]